MKSNGAMDKMLPALEKMINRNFVNNSHYFGQPNILSISDILPHCGDGNDDGDGNGNSNSDVMTMAITGTMAMVLARAMTTTTAIAMAKTTTGPMSIWWIWPGRNI
ncbi:hypothetical protein QOT17_007525 [Balamuthia mandrillaris]